MSMTIPELLKSLSDSGLLSESALSTLQDSPADGRQFSSADDFARDLVKQGHLTKLQAAAALQGKTKNLIFGDYVVLEKLGSGGMGQVFKARHKPTEKLVALKVLSAEAVKNRRLVERFKKEAKAVARLKHPNIVRAYEAGKINRIRYLVMEFVDGENMLDRVKRKGQLSVDETVSCVLQAARGLEYAHQKGIVHRDIKPSNFMRDRKGRVKILDMGLARVEDGEEEDDAMRLTIPGQMLGTARFMAPEQIEDARKSDVRSDIYSLGCTLYFLLRGKAPYSGETVAHTLMAHVSAPIPDLCKKRSDVPQWLGDVFTKMLAKKPTERFQTMGELVEDIQKHLGEELSRHEPEPHERDQVDDEYAELVGDEEGTSLEELFSDDEGPAHSEESFGEAADPDIPDADDAASAHRGFRSVSQSRDEPVDDLQDALSTVPSAPSIKSASAVASVQEFRLDAAATEEFSRPATKASVDPMAEPELGSVPIAERLKNRRLQEAQSMKRMKAALIGVVGLIAVVVIAVMVLRK